MIGVLTMKKLVVRQFVFSSRVLLAAALAGAAPLAVADAAVERSGAGLFGPSLPLLAQQQATAPAGESVIDPSVVEELRANPELGPRLVGDLSPEAEKIRRDQLRREQKPVLPEVPAQTKAAWFTSMMASSPMSMRDMFNIMTAKKKVVEGMSFDEVVEAMEIKANELNFKKVGHNEFWRDVGAITGLPTTRLEVLQFCDAVVGRRMLDYSPEFVIFIPCRIALYEDANGDIWLMTLDWDVTWLSLAWHPDSQLDEALKRDAVRIRDVMEKIMHAGATGEW